MASLVGVVGAFSAGALQRRFGGGRLIVWGSAAAALSYIGLSFTRSAVLAVFVLGLQDFGVAVANVASVTARQRLVPRSLLGRVSSVHRLAVLGAAPFGAVVGGFDRVRFQCARTRCSLPAWSLGWRWPSCRLRSCAASLRAPAVTRRIALLPPLNLPAQPTSAAAHRAAPIVARSASGVT